jgi:EAL domain-containing protein (putative c-di-GMP-specific phosphodiesterase class I)
MKNSSRLPLEQLLSDAELRRSDGVDAILQSVRTHLGMDVAFVAEFGESDRLIRHTDAGDRNPVKAGDRIPLEVGYCQRVVDGRLPELIVDASALPAAAALPETHAIPIGSHLSVPIHLRDGRLYGTFCCFSFVADPSITGRDLRVMHAFADILSDQISREWQASADRAKKVQQITRALEDGQPSIVYQPIYCLKTKRVTAVECLARFNSSPGRTPDVWFDDATRVGLGPTLESAAIKAALGSLERVPPNIDVTINLSPDLISSGVLRSLLSGIDLHRIILEITEHAAVFDYDRLLAELAPLRVLGLRVAIDDAGAGYSGLRHILAVEPDMVKLDISLTRGIDQDRKRRALAGAMIAFAREIDVSIIAEGVETAAELKTLTELGVAQAQGFYMGRPMPLDDLIRWSTRNLATDETGNIEAMSEWPSARALLR